LAELRPTLALFLRFSGIDYDQDEAAGHKLDTYIRWVQNVLARYEAYLLQLTIGDKGSYLYAAFGAPVAHEDDAERAMSAALELRHPPASIDFIDPPQIGISHGQMLTGAYGGTTRCTYGVLGDEVNMAARLMQAAKPGQVLVSRAAQQFAKDDFIWSELPPLKVKGKTDSVIAFSLEGQQGRRALHLREPEYTLPMVGREAELARIEEKLNQVLAGHGQLIGITAEAGMGKSRMVAEVIHIGGNRDLVGYGGECQSFGTNISYLVWQPIWQGLFGIDAAWDVDTQIKAVSKQLAAIDPALVPRLPLLGTVLNLPISDNELTQSFDAKLRKSSLESLLVECLRAKSKQRPLLLVLEDCHWLDPLSHDLLEIIARAIVDLPVLLVMNYRPPDIERLQAPRVSQLAHFTESELNDFSPVDAERLITLKIDQLFGVQTGISSTLIEQITTRAGGNPFYIEELLNYLQDKGFDPHNTDSLKTFDLPTSLHSLILRRIDQLTESQKSTLKVASVIGRLFRAAWLWGMSPELGEEDRIKSNLDDLSRLDLTPMDTPEPELAYLFKHVITQEVAYESLPYATRAILHNQLGQFIEENYHSRVVQYVDILAFHYDRSDNEAKKREYLLKAGEAARADYANQAAIDYFRRVLPLISGAEQVTVTRKLGDVLQLAGEWPEADIQYHQALTLAQKLNDQSSQAWCQTALGELRGWKQGKYAEASDWLGRAQTVFAQINDQHGVGEVLKLKGTLAAMQGNLEEARTLYERSLEVFENLGDKEKIANTLNNLAIVARYRGDYEAARTLNEQALRLRYELGNKWAIANSLNNLGNVFLDQGDYLAARTQLEVAVDLQREIGDRFSIANALHSLGDVTRDQGDYGAARPVYEESLTIVRELGERFLLAQILEGMGGLAALQGQAKRAIALVTAAGTLRETIGAPLSPTFQQKIDDILRPARQTLGESGVVLAEEKGKTMPLDQVIEYALQPD
jgi:predicted ATPase